MGHGYAVAGVEPPLEELLDDQIARLIMRRDGLEPADVWRSHRRGAGALCAPRQRSPADGAASMPWPSSRRSQG